MPLIHIVHSLHTGTWQIAERTFFISVAGFYWNTCKALHLSYSFLCNACVYIVTSVNLSAFFHHFITLKIIVDFCSVNSMIDFSKIKEIITHMSAASVKYLMCRCKHRRHWDFNTKPTNGPPKENTAAIKLFSCLVAYFSIFGKLN